METEAERCPRLRGRQGEKASSIFLKLQSGAYTVTETSPKRWRMGVAIGSVLFLRWLNYYGLDRPGVPPHTQWGETPAVFIQASGIPG